MLKVAITGNIAAGKSVVEKMLREFGFKVLDSDEVAHELILKEDVKKQLIKTFKGYDILEGENVCRKKLGRIVFENEELRRKLEDVLHPLIKDEINNFFIEYKDEKITFVSVPLLFEAKFDNMFDKIILIYADDHIRLDRLINVRNMSPSHAKNRIKIQQDQEAKVKLSDFVIYNNSSLSDLKDYLADMLKSL